MRYAASNSPAFFGLRRTSEIAAFWLSDVVVDESAGAVEPKIRRQRNDQLVAGQMAPVVVVPTWKGARPVRLMSDRLWFRAQLSRFRGRENRMSMPPGEAPLFVGLARARFWFRHGAARDGRGSEERFRRQTSVPAQRWRAPARGERDGS